MRDSQRTGDLSFRLEYKAAGHGIDHYIEFEAPGVEAALFMSERLSDGREAELFENGRSLGRLRNDRTAGFWVITPPSSRAVKPVAPAMRAAEAVRRPLSWFTPTMAVPHPVK